MVLAVALILVGGVALAIAVQSGSDHGDLRFVGFDVDRVYSIESQLTSWPTRHTGTIYEAQTAEYVRDQFIEAGLENVHIEEFEIVEYEVLGASLQLIHYGPLGNIPDPRQSPVTFAHKVDFVVQGFSGSRAQASGALAYRADLDYAVVNGNGTEAAHYQGARGMAAIVETEGGVSNRDIYDVADEAGVAALINHNTIIHKEIDYVPISKSNRQPDGWPDPDYPDIPFIQVSRDCGDTIRAANNAKLRLHVDVDIGMRTVHVTVGESPGKGKADEFVVVCAHHDCVYNNVGAIDNGSGTTTVIELAHQLGSTTAERTIRFITYGGEEDGLFGSFAYVEAHEEEIASKCRAVLNFDMPHVNLQRDNRGFLTPDNPASFDVYEEILDRIYDERPDLESTFNYTIHLMDHPGEVGTDSMPYALLGVETNNFWGSGAWEYHTYMDDLSHFVPEGLEMAVLIGGSYALWVADH